MADHHKHVEVAANGAGSSQDIPEEMMAELKKEIARNLEATKLVKQREIEATYARDRAADSQRRMQEMMVKYEEMKNKLEWTRLTLAETHSRLEHHNSARSERIKQSVTQLKEKADICTQKLNQRATEEVTAVTAGVPAAVALSSDDAGGLTDAERMLLQLCQEQMIKDQEDKSDDVTDNNDVTDENDVTGDVAEPSALDDVIVPEPPTKPKSKDYAKTVLDLQMKLVSTSKRSPPPAESATVAQPEPVSLEEEKPQLVNPEEEKPQLVNPEEEKPQPEVTETAVPSSHDHEAVTTAAAQAVNSCSKQEEAATADSSCEGEEEEITMDLSETVSKMQAKCASVREELGQMAMSEQYMRTKQAQLLAKTREREAQLAMELAAEKEKEAQAMRKKVTDMMKLLEERRNKLKMTEVVLEKKSVVVEKVHKILDSKERRANFVEKQHAECLAFDKKVNKKE